MKSGMECTRSIWKKSPVPEKLPGGPSPELRPSGHQTHGRSRRAGVCQEEEEIEEREDEAYRSGAFILSTDFPYNKPEQEQAVYQTPCKKIEYRRGWQGERDNVFVSWIVDQPEQGGGRWIKDYPNPGPGTPKKAARISFR